MVIMPYNITVYCIFDQINAALVSIRDNKKLLPNHFYLFFVIGEFIFYRIHDK